MADTMRAIRWHAKAVADQAPDGLEHVVLKIAESGISAEAVTIGGTLDDPLGLRWRITIDPDWTAFRSLHLTRLGGATLALRHDGYGEWTDGEGKKRKEFSGLSDVAVDGTPFWLTPLLRRLGNKAAKSQTFDLVHVAIPAMTLERTELTIEPLKGEATEGERRFRLTYAGIETEAAVDADGLVLRWGERITRL